MPRQIIDTFTITIKRTNTQSYTIEASGPNGIRVQPQPFRLLLLPELQTILNNLTKEDARVSSDSIQEIGLSLYKSVFTDQVLLAFGQAQGRVGVNGLRLKLDIEPPELAALPWEAMYDGQEWLAANSDIPFVRALPLKDETKTLQKLQISGPLKIFFVGASPTDLPSLEIEETAQQLQQLLKEDIDKKRIVFDVLVNATLEDLRQQLVKEYHILYFAGHGSPDEIYLDDGEGDEIREGETVKRLPGDKYSVSAQTLAQTLKGKPTRLVFLAACNTGASSLTSSGLLSSFAQELANQAGLPGIVAMQYPISDVQASQMTSQFFAALAAYHPIDVALAEARKALVRQEQVGRDMIAPVMYLQANDGALFQKAKNWAAIGASILAIIAVIAFIIQFLFFQPDRQQITNAQQTAQAEATARAIEAENRATAEARADSEEQLNEARRLAAEAETIYSSSNTDVTPGVLLAVESLLRLQTLEGDQALRRGLDRLPALVSQMKHLDRVESVVFSPDGQWLAIGTYDGMVLISEVSTGQEITRMKLDQGELANAVWAVEFSDDGKLLTASSLAGKAYIWETATWNELFLIEPEGGQIPDVTFCSGSNWLVTAGVNFGGAKVWNSSTGQEVDWIVQGESVREIDCSSDGKILAIASSSSPTTIDDDNINDHIKLWNFSEHQETVLITSDEYFSSLAFSPDGQWLAAGSADNIAHVWNVATGEEVLQLSHKNTVESVTFSPDSKILATAGTVYDNKVKLWEIPSGREITQILHPDAVKGVAFSPDGKFMATASWDGFARVWEATTPRQEIALFQHESPVEDTIYSPDGQWLATRGEDNIVPVWAVDTSEQVLQLNHLAPVNAIAFNTDGKRILTSSEDHIAHLWDITTGQERGKRAYEEADEIAFDNSGHLLATSSSDNGTKIWDVSNGLELVELSYKAEELLTFSPNSQLLATGSGKHIKIWDVKTGNINAEMSHGNSVWDLSFSPDAQWLASASFDGTARVWDTRTGESVARFDYQEQVSKVSFSPDGRFLGVIALGTADIWQVDTEEKIFHAIRDDGISSIVFSSDNVGLATWGGDLIRAWNINSGSEIAQIQHDDSVTSVNFSPDGKFLATGGKDKTARISIVWPEDLIAEACSRLSRNLTGQEWAQYIPNEDYRATCPNLESGAEISKTPSTPSSESDTVSQATLGETISPGNEQTLSNTQQPIAYWTFEVSGRISAPPAVNNSVAYFGSQDRLLYAIDLKSGQLLWKFRTDDWLHVSPAVANGVAYIGSTDFYLYAIDTKTGSQIWRFRTGNEILSSPVVVDNAVYIGSNDRFLFSIDAKTGQENWRFEANDSITSSPTVDGGNVYFGSRDGFLYAIDVQTGQKEWGFETNDIVLSSPTAENGIVFFGSMDGNLYAVEGQSGQERWRFETGDGIFSSPEISNNTVYIASQDRNLYAVDIETGREKWRFRVGNTEVTSPAIGDKTIYIGDTVAGYLYAVDSDTGQQLWRFKASGSVYTPYVEDGVIYFGSSDGNLYALAYDEALLPPQNVKPFPKVLPLDKRRIAFNSNREGAVGTGDIYIMNADGTEQLNLTHEPGYVRNYDWSPDNKQLVFESGRDGNQEIYLVNSDGSELTNITNSPDWDAKPSWSPNGSEIAFLSNRSGRNDLYLMNMNSGNLRNLTNGQGWGGETPVWSPDGTQIAVVSLTSEEHKDEIYIINADGSNFTRITDNPIEIWGDPIWSPDGQYLAFTANREIYIANVKRNDLVNLTNGVGEDGYFSWLPDSQHIVFSTTRDDPDPANCTFECANEIYIANVDSGGVANLTNHSADDWQPILSPDGRRIVFFSDRDGNDELYIMNTNGSEERKLVDSDKNFYNITGVTWSPDSKQVAFRASREMNGEIFIVDVDNGADLRLTSFGSDDGSPRWLPSIDSPANATTRSSTKDVLILPTLNIPPTTTPVPLQQEAYITLNKDEGASYNFGEFIEFCFSLNIDAKATGKVYAPDGLEFTLGEWESLGQTPQCVGGPVSTARGQNQIELIAYDGIGNIVASETIYFIVN